MGKIKSSYANKIEYEKHTMPHSAPKRRREPTPQEIMDNPESLIFNLRLNFAHMLGMVLAAFAPIGLGWSLGIVGCILLSAMSVEIEEEED